MENGTERIEGNQEGETLQSEAIFPTESTSPATEPDTLETEGSDDGEEIEKPLKETAQQTARRIYEELKAEAEQNKGDQSQTQQVRGPDGKFVKKQDAPKAPVQQQAQTEQPVRAPDTWTLEEKQEFNKASPILKSALARREKELHQMSTRATEEARHAIKESEHIRQSVRPYLEKNPQILEAGYTEATFISGLVGAHMALQNPDTKVNKWLAIGKEVGIDGDTLQELSDILQGGGNFQQSSHFDIEQDPKFRALQERADRLELIHQQQLSQQQSSQVDTVAAEMRAVIDEVDANGNYVYPNAHQPDFINKVRPLVSALITTDSQLSYGEALKRSYYTLYGFPNQQTQTRPTHQNFNTQKTNFNRSPAQAVSVRGKTTAPVSVPVMEDGTPIPPKHIRDKGGKETARWIYQQLTGES